MACRRSTSMKDTTISSTLMRAGDHLAVMQVLPPLSFWTSDTTKRLLPHEDHAVVCDLAAHFGVARGVLTRYTMMPFFAAGKVPRPRRPTHTARTLASQLFSGCSPDKGGGVLSSPRSMPAQANRPAPFRASGRASLLTSCISWRQRPPGPGSCPDAATISTPSGSNGEAEGVSYSWKASGAGRTPSLPLASCSRQQVGRRSPLPPFVWCGRNISSPLGAADLGDISRMRFPQIGDSDPGLPGPRCSTTL